MVMERGSAFGSAFGAQLISLQLRRPAALHSELTICGEIFSRCAAPSGEVQWDRDLRNGVHFFRGLEFLRKSIFWAKFLNDFLS